MQKNRPDVYPKMVHRTGGLFAAAIKAQEAGFEEILALQNLYYLDHENLLGRPRQGNTPIRAPVRNKEAVLGQLLQNLCQKMK